MGIIGRPPPSSLAQLAQMVAAEVNRSTGTGDQIQIYGRGNFVQMGGASLDAPGPAIARRKLVETVNAARMSAGKPTLADLAGKVGCSQALLSRLFNGHHVPNKNILVRLGEALGVDPAAITGKWVPLWEVSGRKEPGKVGSDTPATETAKKSDTPDGFECPECGAWVVNAARHITWHVRGAAEGSTQEDHADGGQHHRAPVIPLRKVT